MKLAQFHGVGVSHLLYESSRRDFKYGEGHGFETHWDYPVPVDTFSSFNAEDGMVLFLAFGTMDMAEDVD
jgi:hypothetical protein